MPSLTPPEGEFTDVAVLSDGGLLAVGWRGDFDLDARTALIAQFQPTGSLDQSFGEGGVVSTTFGSAYAHLEQIETYPDGRFLVLAYTGLPNARNLVARFLPNGEFDSSFSDDGVVSTPGRRINGLALQSDGTVLLANGDAVSKLTSAGAMDPSFGNAGVTGLPESAGSVTDLAVDRQGRIVTVGVDNGAVRLAVGRLRANGETETSFGSEGFQSLLCPPDCDVRGAWDASLAIQPDNSIVVTAMFGSVGLHPFNYDMRFRVDDDGELDPAFTGSQGADEIGAPVVAADGGILLAYPRGLRGGAHDSGAFAISRLRPTGSPEPSFGRDGTAVVNITDGYDKPSAAALQSDGAIVAAGAAKGNLKVARFRSRDGGADQDADRITDENDRCRIRYGTDASGCPTYRPKVVLRYGEETRAFIGYIQSRHQFCLPDLARATLFRRHPGRDERIGALESGYYPDFNPPLDSAPFKRHTDDPKRGVYYAKAPERHHAAMGICKATRSNRLRWP